MSRYLRKWFGLPGCTSAANLYSKQSPLPKPLSSTVEEYKAAKCRAVVSLRTSKDDKVTEAGECISSGRKWKPQTAVDQSISRLKHRDVVGTVCKGRTGLGHYGNQTWAGANTRTRRDMIVEQVRESEEEDRQLHLRSLYGQGEWARWEGVVEKTRTWNEAWKMDDGKLKFVLRAVFDLLPSPTNLKRWGIKYDSKCPICDREGCTLRHVLNSCRKSLSEGRYRWRHDQVLKCIAHTIELEIQGINSRNKVPLNNNRTIEFVREGAKISSKRNPAKREGILNRAEDWRLIVDVGKKLVIPADVVTTTLRPDIVIMSVSRRTVILAELTVPWEDRIEEAHEMKASKYGELVDNIKQNGWQVHYFPVEVGSRGYPGKSLSVMYSSLGFSNRECRKICKSVGASAEESSRWLWLRREEPWKLGND